MSRIPRASLAITLLTDEDYRLLMRLEDGPATFGIFVSMVLVARERLQEDKARRLSDTESLICDNSLTHVLDLAGVSQERFETSAKTLAEVAKATGGKPWMSVDKSGHLVIRSFFKFNVPENRGGHRPGAGRPPSQNQTEIKDNQIDSGSKIKPESNPCASSSVSSSVSVSKHTPNPPPENGVCVSTHEPQTRKPDPPPKPSPRIYAPEVAALSEITGPGKDSPEAIALGEWAKTLGSGPDNEPYHVWAKAVCDYTPAEWVRAALEAHVVGRSGANLKSLPYLQGVLKKWFAIGECPAARVIGKAAPKPKEASPWDAPDPTNTQEFRDWKKTYRPNRGAS